MFFLPRQVGFAENVSVGSDGFATATPDRVRRVSGRCPVENFRASSEWSLALRAMPREHTDRSFYLDANGCLTERVVLGGHDVVVHYDDIPDSDITSVDGYPCTTPLRTVIDIAPETEAAELERIVRHCLERGLFSREEALARIAETDMLSRPGAQLLRQVLAIA